MKRKVDISMEEERDDSFRLAENLYNSGVRPTFVYGVTRGGNYVAGPISEYFKWRYERENSKLKEDEQKLELITGSVVAHEYDKRNRPGEVIVEGWAPVLSRVTENDTMILCDDCYDTGNTLRALIHDIELHTPLRKEESPIINLPQLDSYDPSNVEIIMPNGNVELGWNGVVAMMMLNGNVQTKCPKEVFNKKFFSDRQLIIATHDLKYFWGQDAENLRFLPDVTVNIFYCKGKWADKTGPWIQYDRYEMMGLSDEEIEKRYKVKA